MLNGIKKTSNSIFSVFNGICLISELKPLWNYKTKLLELGIWKVYQKDLLLWTNSVSSNGVDISSFLYYKISTWIVWRYPFYFNSFITKYSLHTIKFTTESLQYGTFKEMCTLVRPLPWSNFWVCQSSARVPLCPFASAFLPNPGKLFS